MKTKSTKEWVKEFKLFISCNEEDEGWWSGEYEQLFLDEKSAVEWLTKALTQHTNDKLREDREKRGKRYVTLMNQALGETELPEEVWKKIAKVNQLILDK